MSVRWRGWCFSAEVEKEYDCMESSNKAQGDRMGFMIREVMCPSLQWPRMPGNFSQMLKTSLGTSVVCMKITPEAVIGQEAGYTPNRSLVCCRANPRKSLEAQSSHADTGKNIRSVYRENSLDLNSRPFWTCYQYHSLMWLKMKRCLMDFILVL